MAASFTAIEGRVRFAQDVHNGQQISGFKLVLFTNAVDTLTQASVATDLTQPTGGGYSAASIAQGGWTVDPATGTTTHANVDFTPVGSNYSAPVTGAATLITYSGVDYLYGVQYFDTARTVEVGGKETIDMSTILGA